MLRRSWQYTDRGRFRAKVFWRGLAVNVLVVLVFFSGICLGFYPDQCSEGYFNEGEICKACDVSCKTCEEAGICSSCEDFMYLNSTTGLCKACPKGEYYDQVGDICNPCNGACSYGCLYQAECFMCPEHEIFDINAFKCVDVCESGKIFITSEQLSIGTICKFPTIYVEPLSDKDVELGTLEYPYRSFKSASAEILNFYSHSDKNITVYVKDGYIEMDTSYFLNLTNVKITNHPDYQDTNRRAKLIFSTIEQPGVSPKARFHILKNDFLNLTAKISDGNFMERELSEISKAKTGFVVARTGFDISNIEWYSSELDYFLVPIFFQSKLLKLENMHFNVTGLSIQNFDPMIVYLDNIVVDISRQGKFLRTLDVICNYPEAHTHGSVYINDLKGEISIPQDQYGYVMMATHFPANQTYSNINCSQHFVDDNFQACIGIGYTALCNPADDLVQTHVFDNIYDDGEAQNHGGGKVFFSPGISFTTYHRQIINNATNFTFMNIKQISDFGFLYFWGSGSDITTLSNFRFHNCSNSLFYIQILMHKSLELRNFTIEESRDHPGGLLDINIPGDLLVVDITFQNFTSGKSSQAPIYSLSALSSSTFTFEGIVLKDSELENAPLIKVLTAFKEVLISSLWFEDMVIPTEGSVLTFDICSTLSISNLTLKNVSPLYDKDLTSSLLYFPTFDYEKMDAIDVHDIAINNSVISLIKTGTVPISETKKNITYQNISYMNSVIPSNRKIINTYGFFDDFNLRLIFDQLHFENISCPKEASLLGFQHKLSHVVEVTNSTFINISDGLIAVGGQYPSELPTYVRISNSVIEDVILDSFAFATAHVEGILKIENCSFSRITSINILSRIIDASEGGKITITDSSFQNNSAIENSIFMIEAQSYVKCYNCTIYNNFALKNAVFNTISSGIIVLENSNIYQNYAIETPVGTVFQGVEESEINNTQIHSNSLISKNEIANETSSNCDKLCFLDSEMKEYLAKLDLNYLSESETWIQLLQGELHIVNYSHIYSGDSQILSCFASTLLIEDSTISDINFTKPPIEAILTFVQMNSIMIQRGVSLSTNNIHSFILATSSTVQISNLKFYESNSHLMELILSSGSLSQLEFENVTNSEFIRVLHCDSFTLRNISVRNVSFTSESLVTIQNSQDVNLQDMELTGLQAKISSITKSQVSSIKNIKSIDGTQAFKFVKTNVTEIINSMFSNNTHQDTQEGGAIEIADSRVLIKNTTFSRNSASSGGAIFFGCTSLVNCQLVIDTCIFSNNSATEKGGAIHYNYNQPKISTTSFLNNFAPYGSDLASYPSRIGLIENQLSINMTINNVASGITIDKTLRFALFDINNQIMNMDNSSKITITAKNGTISSIKGTNVVSASQGVADFTNIAAVIDLNYRVANFSVKSQTIDKNKVLEVLGSDGAQKDLVINFRDCQPGEKIIGNQCYFCDIGTYSLTWNSTECKECDLNADCLGGQQLFLSPGYWRQFRNSTKIAECVNKDACEGGYNADDLAPSKCADGYSGVLCAQCFVNSEVKYERVNDFECRKCPNVALNATRVVGTIIIIFVFYFFIILINVRKTSESRLSVLLRILTNYLQLLTVVTSMTNEYPSTIIFLSIPMKMFGGSTDSFLSFDCFIEDAEIKLLFNSNAIFKLFILMFLPFILFILMTFMWLLIYWVKRKWIKDLKRNLAISFITIVFMLHPKLTERSISMFKCVEADDGFSVTRIDTNIECFSSTHLKWCFLVVVPILIVWVIACPSLALFAILSGKRNPENNKMHQYLLMTYQGLKPEAIYWEFVNTLRKVAILVSLLFPKTISICISLAILIITARIEVKLKPYKDGENCKLEFLAIVAGVCTIMSALIYSRNEEHSVLDTIVLLIVILVNFKFLIEWVYLVFCIYKEKHTAVEQTVKIMGKCLCKRKILPVEPKEPKKEPQKNVTTQKVLNKTLRSVEGSENKLPSKARPRTPKRLIKHPRKIKRNKISKKTSKRKSRKSKLDKGKEFEKMEEHKSMTKLTTFESQNEHFQNHHKSMLFFTQIFLPSKPHLSLFLTPYTPKTLTTLPYHPLLTSSRLPEPKKPRKEQPKVPTPLPPPSTSFLTSRSPRTHTQT